MASKIDICNMALANLGDRILTNLDEDNQSARLCKKFYDIERDALIESYPWSFAIKRAKLNQDTTAPEFEYTYAYVLPNDYLRALKLYGAESAKFSIEAGRLLTDEVDENSQVMLKYIGKVVFEGEWTPAFTDALAWRLATRIAMPLTKDGKLRAEMMKGMLLSVKHAYLMGAIEDDPAYAESNTTWQQSRT